MLFIARRGLRTPLCLVALCTASSLPAQSLPLRLTDAIARAARVSPALREGRAQQDAANAQRRGAAARLLPEFSTAIDVQRNPQLNAAILPAEVFGGAGDPRVVRLGTPYESGFTRTLRVPLFDAAQRSTVRESQRLVDRTAVAVQQTHEQVILSVTDAYVTLHARRAEYEAAQALVNARAEQRRAGEQRLAAGRTTAQQLDLLRLAEDDARRDERHARMAMESATDGLRNLIAADVRDRSLVSLQLEDDLDSLLSSRREVDRSSMDRTVDIDAVSALRLARVEERVAAAASQRARRQSWPTLRLVGTLSTVAFANGLQDVTLSGRRFTRSALALQFEPPTLDFGVRRAQRAEAEALVRAATSKREAVERDARLAEREAWRARELALVDLESATEALRVRSRALVLCEAEAAGGRGGADAVVEARAVLAAARAAEVSAKAAVIRRDTEWRRSAGLPLHPGLSTNAVGQANP